MKKPPPLSKKQAVSIINSLKKGTPPDTGVELYSEGRKDLIAHFDTKLKEVKLYDTSDIKFISADWGHGKSHFLDLLRDLSLKHNFIVSKVELKSNEVSFDQLSLVVQRMMANIITPKERINGLEALLNRWSESNGPKSKDQIFKELQSAGIFPDMRLKLVEYEKHYNCPEGPELQECLNVLKWFQGTETKSKMFKSVPEFIRGFTLFVRLLGYSGLVVLLDEAEAIVSLSRIGKRDLANENIRQVIDNDLDTKNFYLVFASTSSFLSGEDERGAQSYPALWRRINDPLQEIKTNSLEKVIIELPELSEDQFANIAKKLGTFLRFTAARNSVK